MRPDIAPGGTFPDYGLPDHESVVRRLSEIQGDDPMIVTHARGRLDIQEYTDPGNDPMIPHTLVLKPGLVIHSVYNGYWFWGRPSMVDLWHDLRTVFRDIRPDWDLGAPGLRAAWDAGDLSAFHGWNRWGPERAGAVRSV